MKRYRHNRSHTRLTSFDMGKIIPTMSKHCVAGTSLVGGVAAGLQLAPMVHQALTQIRVDTFAISVADRLIWDDAEVFYTGGEDGKQRPIVPYVVAPEGGWKVGSTMDHLGFPTGVSGLKCDARPLRCLIKWWNENCRDEQLQEELPLSTASGEDTTTYTGDLRINWPKDRFTTARPEPTLGEDVVIPVASKADVVFSGSSGEIPQVVASDPAYVSGKGNLSITTGSNNRQYITVVDNPNPQFPNLSVDLSKSTGILPDDFNFAMARARWKSRRNLFGTDFRDWLAFLGVRYSDRRLGYSSTLAHGRQMVDINAVLQTAPGTNSAVGQVAGRGTGFGVCKYRTYFEEPTTVVHLIVVRPAPVYVNMYPEEWDIQVREDDYTPEFAHVGMAPIKSKILFPTGVEANDEAIWGYSNRYDFMRTGLNSVTGSMKTTGVSYHQGRIFETKPELNSDFLTCHPTGRIFAITDETIMDQIEAAAIRNTFIEKNMVTPNGDPHYN